MQKLTETVEQRNFGIRETFMTMLRRSLLKTAGFWGLTTGLTGGLTGLWSMAMGAESVGATELLEAAELPKLPKLTMQLDWQFNVQFAGLLLADDLGLYRQQGLEVVIQPSGDGVVVADAVAQNLGMVGCLEQNVLLDAQAQGQPLKAIATMFQVSPYALMALPDRGIQTLEDLRGQRVGVHSDGVKVMALVQGVNGLQSQEIEVVEIPAQGKGDRLLQGEFAAVQCYAVDEPIAFAQQLGQMPTLISLATYGYDAYAQVLFASDETLRRYHRSVQAFLNASFNGWQQALDNIPGTAKLIAEKYAKASSQYTNVNYQTKSLELMKNYVMYGIDRTQIGMINGDRWQKIADLMMQYKIIQTAPSLDACVDSSLWQGL